MKSNYYNDKMKEELFAKWLDEHFYSRYKRDGVSFRRVVDESEQRKGIDIIATLKSGKTWYIDEKAALDYLTISLPTFAFEVKNMNTGAKGWLWNENLSTNMYVLAWPSAERTDITSVDDFIEADIVIIKREAVKKILEENNITEELVQDKIEQYEKGVLEVENGKYYLAGKKISLYFNKSKKEKPVLILISKKLLKDFSVDGKIRTIK